MKDNDIMDLLGLTDKTLTLEYDILANMDHKTLEDEILKVMNSKDNQDDKHKEFIQLFKECFDELCEFMKADSQRRIPVSCFTCIRGMELRDKYGSPKQ